MIITKMSRFGNIPLPSIDRNVQRNVPYRTKKCKNSIWNQFVAFCRQRNYELSESLSEGEIANILKDWAFNMRRLDGEEYKESCVKTMWNSTAKMVQELYFEKYKRKIDPFTDIAFKGARDAKNLKRKHLQVIPEKRKISATGFSRDELDQIIDSYNENNPEGLQKKFFHVASYTLAWKGGEACTCTIRHFSEEIIDGGFTGRIKYTRVFTNTSQDSSIDVNDNTVKVKWLTPNIENESHCPVRLFRKLIEKRGPNITTDRLFLTSNPFWEKSGSWYKNSPVGHNQMSKWTHDSAVRIGLDVKKRRLVNDSHRLTAESDSMRLRIEHKLDQELAPWTQQQTSILLEEFKKYPNLYKRNHKDFQNSQLRSACINQIIQKLIPFRPGVKEVDVLCKFSSLKAIFQEVRIELEAFQGGIKEIEEQRWWCYKQMQFLVHPIPDQSDVEDQPQFVVVKNEPIADLQNSEWENCIFESKDPLSTSMETIVVKEESENFETPSTSQTSSEASKDSDTSSKDENDIFGEFVASQLKKITDESLRQDTIFEIHKILHKAVRNYK